MNLTQNGVIKITFHYAQATFDLEAITSDLEILWAFNQNDKFEKIIKHSNYANNNTDLQVEIAVFHEVIIGLEDFDVNANTIIYNYLDKDILLNELYYDLYRLDDDYTYLSRNIDFIEYDSTEDLMNRYYDYISDS